MECPDADQRRAWIDSDVEKLNLERERLSEIMQSQTSVAYYLNLYCRCAIAHGHHRPYVDPDKAEQFHRLARDARLIKGSAKMAIESMS